MIVRPTALGPAVGRIRTLLLPVVLGFVLGACAGTGSPTAAGACADTKAAGTYPALEALLPRELAGATPTLVDSGRDCSPTALGTLVDRGVTELDFAGATWDSGNGKATSIAVLSLPAGQSLPAAWAEEFYEVSARSGKKTDHIDTSRPTFPSVGAAFRLDALNDLSFQSVVVWQDGLLVRVAIVATPVNPSASRDEHDARVQQAVAAAANAPHVAPS